MKFENYPSGNIPLGGILLLVMGVLILCGNSTLAEDTLIAMDGTSTTQPSMLYLDNSPLVRYSFDRDNGDTVTNSMGLGDGIAIGNPQWTPRGLFGSGMKFSGGQALYTGIRSPFSYSQLAYFVCSNLSAGTEGGNLVSDYQNEPNMRIYQYGDGRIIFEAGLGNHFESPAPNDTYDTWHCYAWSCDGQRCYAYIDKEFQGTLDYVAPYNVGYGIYVGARNVTGEGLSERITSTIDDVRIYSMNLTHEDVESLFNSIYLTTTTTTITSTTTTTTTTTTATTTTTQPVCERSASYCGFPEDAIQCGHVLEGCLYKSDWKHYRVTDSANMLVTVNVTYTGEGCNENEIVLRDQNCDWLYQTGDNESTKNAEVSAETDVNVILAGYSNNTYCTWRLEVNCADIIPDDPPVVSFSVSPTSAVVGENISLTVSATDDKGLYRLFVKYGGYWYGQSCDGALSCTKTWQTTEYEQGNYTYYGDAYDTKRQRDPLYLSKNKTVSFVTTTTTSSTTTTTLDQSVKCWDAADYVAASDDGNLNKTCKCIMGLYAFLNYTDGAISNSSQAYVDRDDNTNWNTTLLHDVGFGALQCPDGGWYPANRDYYSVCRRRGDYPPCEYVSVPEVVDLIELWRGDEAQLFEVVDLISAWVASPQTSLESIIPG